MGKGAREGGGGFGQLGGALARYGEKSPDAGAGASAKKKMMSGGSKDTPQRNTRNPGISMRSPGGGTKRQVEPQRYRGNPAGNRGQIASPQQGMPYGPYGPSMDMQSLLRQRLGIGGMWR